MVPLLKRQIVECVIIAEDITADVIIITGELHGRYYTDITAEVITGVLVRVMITVNRLRSSYIYIKCSKNNHQIFRTQRGLN